ncbi:AAA family ATPase [Amycolatopsis sp. NPDC004378]
MTRPTPPATASVTGPTTPAGAKATRLRNGELRAMVAKVLADDPATTHSPGSIARTLNRSSGAVGNACKTLADAGAAELASTAPLGYRATAMTAAAAAPVITPAPPCTPRAPRRKPPATAPAASSTPSASSSTAGVTTRPATTVTGTVKRPNGMDYHPRLLSGMPDVTALQRLRDAGVAALLYGPPGTGKTSVVEAAFNDCLTVQGDCDTVVADLVGDFTKIPGGDFVFVHGPLVRAMREGLPLFIDDATLIPPTVLAVVYPAMDGRREIVVKPNGSEVVKAAPGFYVVAGHNPGVHGAILTDALSSRFSVHIQVSSDYALAEQLGVDKKAVRVARNLATRQEKGEIGWAPQLRELLAFKKLADAWDLDAAAGNLVGIAPEEDRVTVAAVVRDVFGKTVAPLALGARVTAKP